MFRKWIVMVGLVLLGMISLLGYAFLHIPESASRDIQAIPLEITPAANILATFPPSATASVSEIAEETTTNESIELPAVTESGSTTTPAGNGLTILQLSQSDSEVRFELDEDLRGQRLTVIGTTNQVAGEIAFNLNDLSQTQIGVLQINARTLQTDNGFRNRAIQNQILDTGQYEYITFSPTAIKGLPTSAAIGDTINFTLEGDLTIRNLTLPAIFMVQATIHSEQEIVGTASTIITRADYQLTIPNVPNVANVEQEVELYIDFVAKDAP